MFEVRRCLAIFAVLVMGLAACGDNTAGGEGNGTATEGSDDQAAGNDECPDGPFRWFTTTSLSGPLATLGEHQAAGLKAAVDVVNEAGGVMGRQVELQVEDNRSDPTEALSLVQEAVNAETKPDLVTPATTTPHALPALPVMNDAQVPNALIMSSTAYNDPDTYPYSFGVTNTAPHKADALIEWLDGEGYASAGVLLQDNELGEDILENLESLADEAGLEISSETVPADAVDPTAQLERLRRNGPEALVVATGPGAHTIAVLNTRETLGWDVPTILDDSTSGQDFSELSDDTLANTTLMLDAYGVKGHPVLDTEAYQLYEQAIEEHVEEFVFASNIYTLTYSALPLAKAAYEKAGSCDPDEVRSAWESLTTDDAPLWFLSNEFGYSEDNHAPAYSLEDFEFVPGVGLQREGQLFVPADSGE